MNLQPRVLKVCRGDILGVVRASEHGLVLGREKRPSLAKVEVPGRTESWMILSEGSPGRRCGALPWKVEGVSQPEGSGRGPHSWHRELLGLPGACVGTHVRFQLPLSAPVEQNGVSSDTFTPTLTPVVCMLWLYQQASFGLCVKISYLCT